MFHNLKSTTERLVTVLMLVGALIACEKLPESASEPEPDNNNLVPIESKQQFLNNTQSLIETYRGQHFAVCVDGSACLD